MQSYDYVVVGAGTAGCVIASRLTEKSDVRVLLLEAGNALTMAGVGTPQQWATLRGTSANWGETTVVQATTGTSIPLPRGRGLGGSSSINAMLFARGHRSSYDEWVSRGAVGWGFDDLLPFLRRSETTVDRDPALRGVDGPLAVGPGEPRNPFVQACWDAATELGFRRAGDISGGLEHGFGRVDQNVVDGRRQSAEDAYLVGAAERPNLTVVTSATVDRLRLDGHRCTGLEYRTETTGESVSVACHGEVVLTAGAIGSAKLLMLSGMGPHEHLRELGIPVTLNLPGVGSNLHDHPTCAVVYLPAQGVSPKMDNHLERVLGLVHSQLADGNPDLQILFQDNPVAGPNQTAPPQGYSIRASLMTPHSRGSVRLSSADPNASPILDPNYYSDERDIQVMRDGLRMAREIGQAEAMAPWRAAEALPGPDIRDEPALSHYIFRSLGSYSHPVGTCRMGADEDAVVDVELRLRGIDGVRVADGSIIPSIPSANTNATVYGIAERAAELIGGPNGG